MKNDDSRQFVSDLRDAIGQLCDEYAAQQSAYSGKRSAARELKVEIEKLLTDLAQHVKKGGGGG
jgi:flagellar capping protein FliD